MVGERFEILLNDLGKILKIGLKPDSNNACLLRFNDGLEIHMEPGERNQLLHIVSNLGEVPQGKYRENLFREALKANGLPPPKNGIFAYGKKTEALLLTLIIPLDTLTGQKLADLLNAFIPKAKLWREAVTSGRVPSYNENELSFQQGSSQGGLFGLVS